MSIRNEIAAMRTLELVLIFHAGGPPNVDRWEEITGTSEMTTKVMCDTIRVTLMDFGLTEREVARMGRLRMEDPE